MNGLSFQPHMQICSRAVCKLLEDDKHENSQSNGQQLGNKTFTGTEGVQDNLLLEATEAITAQKGF